MRKKKALPTPPKKVSFRKAISELGALESSISVDGVGTLTRAERIVEGLFLAAEGGSESAMKFLATHFDGTKVVVENEEFATAVVSVALEFIPSEKWGEFRAAVKGVLEG